MNVLIYVRWPKIRASETDLNDVNRNQIINMRVTEQLKHRLLSLHHDFIFLIAISNFILSVTWYM